MDKIKQFITDIIDYDNEHRINPAMFLVEEMSELTIEILHAERGRAANVIEELAQVMLMIDVIRQYWEIDMEELKPHMAAMVEKWYNTTHI